MPETLLSIPVGELLPDPTQPRKSFLQGDLERLAASMAARGVLQPLRVIRDEERKCWRIVTGESRYRAAGIAGLGHLPCLVMEGDPDEPTLLADQLVENTVRHDLRPLELARALAKLKAWKRCTSQALAKELGLSNAAITRAESLLSLPEDIQGLVDDGKIPESTAYEISRLPDEASMREVAQAVAAGGLSRDQAAEVVRSRIGKKGVQPKAARLGLKLDNLMVSLSSSGSLGWEELIAALDQIRREAKRLCDGGKEISALAQAFRAR